MGRGRRVYTPTATTEFENALRDAYEGPMFDGPVAVTIDLHKDGLYVTVRDVELGRHGLRGDIDNYAKAVLDGLQGDGGAFLDDKQIQDLQTIFVRGQA